MVERWFHMMGRKSMQTGTQAIDRAAQLLVLVVENEESSSVGGLAEAAGLPKSTVSRALSALERQGLVQRNGARGTVRPGPVLLSLAHRGIADDDIVSIGGTTPVAAISISGPDLRLHSDRLADLGALLIHETTELSERLGHRSAKEASA